MKKHIALVLAMACLCLSGCGEQNPDVGGTGMLRLPDGTIVQGEIESLIRWSHSNYEVTIDGKIYVVHPYAFVVIKEAQP